MNDTQVGHQCSNGTSFYCGRADLSMPVWVERPYHVTDADFHRDLIEFGAWHAMHVRYALNGFSGYDAVEIRMSESTPGETS